MALKIGQRVKFRPSHQKELLLSGKIEKLHDDKRSVDIVSDAGNGSVSRLHTAHVDEITPIEDAGNGQ